MNSRKKLAVLWIFILSTLVWQQSFAQTFKYDPLGGFKFTTPAPPNDIESKNPNQINPKPFYTYFLETGNGRYIKDTNQIHNEYTTQQNQIGYNYLIRGNSPALLNLVSHYDTTKPPKMVYYPSNTNGLPLSPQQNLGRGRYIGLDHSLGFVFPTVVKNDMMTTVITYRPDIPDSKGTIVAANCIVAFFYNKTDWGGSIFDVLTPSKAYPMTFNDGPSDFSNLVPAIRKPEESGIYTDVNDIPQATDNVKAKLGTEKGQYEKALYFTIPDYASLEEKNIFLSMLPVNSPSCGNSTIFKAYIIKYTSNGIIGTRFDTDTLNFNEYSRDPNGITTSPACLNSPPGSLTGRPIRYDVDFQNDGEYPTPKVIDTVYLPDGIAFPSGLLNITAKINGQDISFERYTIGNGDLSNTYQLITTRNHVGIFTYTYKMIIFRMPKINLPGTRLEPTNDSLRHGRISFTLYTSTKENPTVEPFPQSPGSFNSSVSIVFYSTIKDRLKENPPIRDHTFTLIGCPVIIP